eukprot:gene7387-6934_t
MHYASALSHSKPAALGPPSAKCAPGVQVGLVRCAGCLWVDTLRRGNFTLDTNVFLSHTVAALASAHTAINGIGGPRAAHCSELSALVSGAVNARLWAPDRDGGDHYVTQLQAGRLTTKRTFDDSDAYP